MKKFESDGCTGVPDFNIRYCCVQHDNDYFDGVISRAKADLLFFQCIVSKGNKKSFLTKLRYTWLALYYWAGVRIFGKSHYKPQ